MNNGSLSLSKFFPLSQSFFLSLRCGWMRWFLCSVWKMRSAFRRSTTTIVAWPTTATQQRCPWCLWELRVSVKCGYIIWQQLTLKIQGHVNQWLGNKFRRIQKEKNTQIPYTFQGLLISLIIFTIHKHIKVCLCGRALFINLLHMHCC